MTAAGASPKLICSRSYSALLPRIAEFLQSASSEVLLLAPSKGAADDLARRCCPAGALGLHRMTLNQLAAALATPRMVAEGKAPASRLAMEAMSARVAHALRKEGGIPYFAPVASMPGFSKALTATFTELRLDEFESARLRETGQPGKDLAALLALYEEKMDQAALADMATLLRLATAAALDGKHRFANLPIILFDPPLDSVCARDLVQALVSRSPHVLAVTLAGDKQIYEAVAETIEPTSAPSQLDRVRTSLFLPQAAASDETDESLDYFSAPGEGGECVEIARRIRRLSDADIPFDRIAVLLRDPERYQPFLEEALRRAGVAAYFSRGVVRPDPAGRAFLALLACAREGCSATRFAEYLSLGQVPSPDAAIDDDGSFPLDDELLASFVGEQEPREQQPAADNADDNSPVIGGTLQSPIGWEDMLVDAAVIGGVERWERRLKGLEAELQLQLSEADESSAANTRLIGQIERLGNLQRFAIPVIRRLHALPENAIWGEWLQALSGLARAALRRPEPVLSILSELQSMEEVGPVVLDEVIEVLSARLRFLRREPSPRRYGSVYVASIDEARGRSFDVVFLPGLAEGLFPRKMMEDPLLLDVYRRPPLMVQDDRVVRERMLLRRAVAVAARRLIFSYPRMDVAQSRPRVPSLYALEILRAAMGRLPELRDFEKRAAEGAQARLDWPAPRDHKDAIDDAEYDLVSLDRALKGGQRGSVRYLVEVNEALARSLRGRAWRWKSKWTYADGLVDPDDATRAALAKHGLTERSYSASSLQQFALCPYRFLLHAVHQLRPREAPVALEQMDPLTRGGLFHAMQRDLFMELKAMNLLPVNRERLGRVRDIADHTLDLVAADYAEKLAPAIPRVWNSEVEEIRTDLHGWLGQVAASDDSWLPIHFELGFGMARDARRDPASTAAEAVLSNGVRLRGSIDLVEKHATRGTLRVIDHKTGKAPEREPVYVGGGAALQPLLYALSAEAILGVPVEASELSYCTQRGNYQRIETLVTPGARQFIGRVLDIVGNFIGEGFLPAAPQTNACSLCDYKPVCGPHEELRSGKKKVDRLEALVELRNMP
jgi:ATP-dependent helicase/nuclease subunit B